ncbi:hypothetical protein IMSAGC019_00013 [Lachnospiraceae bacterium]|nr:hypothetical protein IMSAGC019_00013 [Lachnospiraceae bacterium]
MNINIISKYLQFLRKSNNYTQDDLAKELGISRHGGVIILFLTVAGTINRCNPSIYAGYSDLGFRNEIW